MTNDQPTLEEWKELYEAARMFKEFAPWKWMADSDLFGIKDPESGEVGYCCILGGAGEVYGLLVYLGNEGLSLFEGIQSGAIDIHDEDLHALQKCLALTFDDRDMLNKKDLAVIKELGLKFKGRQVWPSFRSHLPGYAPYFLSSPEARFLHLALRYAMGVAERMRENQDTLKSPKSGAYLVGSLTGKPGITWNEEWLAPVPFVREEVRLPIDEVRLMRIKSQSKMLHRQWEIDFFFGPLTVAEGSRFFYPRVALYVVHKEHYILGFTLAKRSEFPATFMDNFLGTLEQIKVLPDTIIVMKEEVHRLLKPITDKLGITLKRARSLKAIENAKMSLLESMTQ
jgi:hypothetical protein